MKLIYQYVNGSRAEDGGEFHSYIKARDAALIHFQGNPLLVAAYLRADPSGFNAKTPPRFVRTFTRSGVSGCVDVGHGYHPYPEPSTVVPGLLWPSGAYVPEWGRTGYLSPRDKTDWRDMPERPADKAVTLTQRAYDQELADADQKGYNRGFKVGISHRNRDRAAQLRRQADSLERVADAYTPPGVKLDRYPPLYPYQEAGLDRYRAFFADYGELEARAVAHYGGGRNLGKSAALGAPYGLPGSVRAGVRGWSAEESKRPTFTVDLGHNRR